jgi:hypothetical protein
MRQVFKEASANQRKKKFQAGHHIIACHESASKLLFALK